MVFITGFAVWIAIGLVAGFALYMLYKGPETTQLVTLTFGIFGAFIGGMLGNSAYIHHDPNPLRFGGLLGAVLGATFFTFVYHFVAKKAV